MYGHRNSKKILESLSKPKKPTGRISLSALLCITIQFSLIALTMMSLINILRASASESTSGSIEMGYMRFSECGTMILDWIVVTDEPSSPTNIVIPAQAIPDVDIVSISDRAFMSKGLTSITFAEGCKIQSIGAQAFFNNPISGTIELPDTVSDIGDNAFAKTNISSIIIPNTAVTLGNGVFSECKNLKAIDLSHLNTISIPLNTFSDSTSLHTVLLPSKVTNIGTTAFQNTTSLTSINFPATLNSIGSSAFNKSGLKRIDLSHTNVKELASNVFSGNSYLYEVILPDSLHTIGNWAFTGASLLTEMSFPAGLKTVGTSAFSGCINLTKVDLSNTQVESLENDAFGSGITLASKLNEVILPETLISIGDEVFRYNINLMDIVIPASVKSIGTNAFGEIGENGTIDLSAHSPGSIPGAPWGAPLSSSILWGQTPTNASIFEFDPASGLITGLRTDSPDFPANGVIQIPNSIEIDSVHYSVKGFASNAFSATESRGVITSVTFKEPSNITSIPESLFRGCTNLNSITLPRSLTIIGRDAFNGCTNLVSVVLPQTLLVIEAYAFSGCINLSNIDFQRATSLTTIGNSAFFNQPANNALTSITFPALLESIGDDAFGGNVALTTVRFTGSEISTIGTSSNTAVSVFNRCDNLKNIYFDAKTKDSIAFRPWGALNAFVYWSDATNFPDYLVVDDTWVFNPNTKAITGYIGPTGLDVDIVVPGTLTYEGISYPITQIEAYWTGASGGAHYIGVIPEGKQLNSLTISPGITSVGAFTFSGVNIEKIDFSGIRGTVTRINNRAFSNCKASSLVLPNTLARIDNEAFSGNSLTSVILPDSLTLIGANAFAGNSLTSVVLPERLTTLSSSAFLNNNLTGTIIIPGRVISVGNSTFSGNPGITDFIVRQYRQQASDGVYNLAENKFLQASYGLTSTMPWGSSLNATTQIRFMDDPGLWYTYMVIPEPGSNTVKIILNVKMNNDIQIGNIEAGPGMPELTAKNISPIGSLWSTVEMIITSDDGNGFYKFLTTYLFTRTEEFQIPVDNFKYTIEYHGNSNTSGSEPSEKTTYIEDATLVLSNRGNMKRDDYMFYGWTKTKNPEPVTTKAGLTALFVHEAGEIYTFTKTENTNIKLYAVWGLETLDNRKVLFDPDGGLFPTTNSKESVTVDVNDGTVIGNDMPENPIRHDYVFVGWFEVDDIQVTEEKIIDRDIEAKAKWVLSGDSQINKALSEIIHPETESGEIHIHYTITYRLPENIHLANNLVLIDEHDSKLSLIGGGVSIRLGDASMSLKGVSVTQPSGMVKIVISGNSFSAEDAGKDIKATIRFRADAAMMGTIFNKVKIYIDNGDKENSVDPADPESPKLVLHVVTFDANGGLFSDNTRLKTQLVEQGKSATAPTPDPKSEGWAFKGWDMDFTNITDSLIVKALYEKVVIEQTYTVTFVDWNGFILNVQRITQGDSAIAPPDPTRTGYTFTSWNRSFTNIQSDLVITAIYTIIPPVTPPPVTPPPVEPTPPPVVTPPPVTPPPVEPTPVPPVVGPVRPPGVRPRPQPPQQPPSVLPQVPDDVIQAPIVPVPTPTPPPPEPIPPQQVVEEPDRTVDIQDDVPVLYPVGNTLDQIRVAGSPSITFGNRVIPLYAGSGLSHLVWALLNLILSIASLTLVIMIGFRFLTLKTTEWFDDKHAETHYETEEEAKKAKRIRIIVMLAVPFLAIVSMILFLLTQDMSLVMVIIDWWTPVHLALFIAALICYAFAFRRRVDEVEEVEFQINVRYT